MCVLQKRIRKVIPRDPDPPPRPSGHIRTVNHRFRNSCRRAYTARGDCLPFTTPSYYWAPRDNLLTRHAEQSTTPRHLPQAKIETTCVIFQTIFPSRRFWSGLRPRRRRPHGANPHRDTAPHRCRRSAMSLSRSRAGIDDAAGALSGLKPTPQPAASNEPRRWRVCIARWVQRVAGDHSRCAGCHRHPGLFIKPQSTQRGAAATKIGGRD